jgi:deazaflavin-dependent oxidoreductase (nitroreductase family)
MATDRNTWEEGLIADMRAHDGQVTQGPLAGNPLLIVTMTGAKSGEPRRVILTYSRSGDDYIVAGSKGGAPTDPVWLANMRANPLVSIEAANRTFPAIAEIVEGPEHDRLWNAHVAALPFFGDYPAKAGRIIPVVRLRPV